jgi:N-acyl-D-amino-acid deacylase
MSGYYADGAMRRSILFLLATGVLSLIGAALACAHEGPVFDVILRNGTVFDGTGAPGERMDVGIRDGFIVALGDLGHGSARLDIHRQP